MSVALDGLHVLALARGEDGSSCTPALPWLGGGVVKVEPPCSDPLRRLAPGMGEESGYLLHWNGTDRSLVIDGDEPDAIKGDPSKLEALFDEGAGWVKAGLCLRQTRRECDDQLRGRNRIEEIDDIKLSKRALTRLRPLGSRK